MQPDLRVSVGPIKLRNPILLASGTVGYGPEIAEFTDLSKIGGIVTKSLSLNPRKGNPPQRIVETSSGMLNAIGLANVGVEEFIEKKIPYLAQFDTTVICNIAASSFEEYYECVSMLSGEEVIDAFEINVSCPNVKDGGLVFGNDSKAVGKITAGVRKVTNKPIIIKLSPNTASVSEFASIAKSEGADAVSAINTLVGSAIDIHSRKPKIYNVTGGLSGPAIKPVAVAKVLEIFRKVEIPIIGIGGIMNGNDIAEFMIAGASAIQMGTVNFINPDASLKAVEELKQYCITHSIERLSELTGSVIL